MVKDPWWMSQPDPKAKQIAREEDKPEDSRSVEYRRWYNQTEKGIESMRISREKYEAKVKAAFPDLGMWYAQKAYVKLKREQKEAAKPKPEVEVKPKPRPATLSEEERRRRKNAYNRAYNKVWRVRNPEKILAQRARHLAKHHEAVLVRRREHRAKNRDRLLAKQREYDQKIRDRYPGTTKIEAFRLHAIAQGRKPTERMQNYKNYYREYYKTESGRKALYTSRQRYRQKIADMYNLPYYRAKEVHKQRKLQENYNEEVK